MAKNETDPLTPHQREEEVNRQRAYGERPDAKDTDDAGQPLPGYKRGSPEGQRQDHGIFRNDGQTIPAAEGDPTFDRMDDRVKTMEDDRSNTTPDTMGADRGPKPDAPTRDDPNLKGAKVNREELRDGYSIDDGAVDKKG